jgi:5-methylcytosine-specific restriction endonuclease McrA
MTRNYNRRTKEELQEVINKSTSWAQVLGHLGLKLGGGSVHHLKKKAKEFGIDTSHFTGQGHNKGKVANNRLPAEAVLVNNRLNGRKDSRARLVRALDEIGRDYECEWCGIDGVWLGKAITLEIDHINGSPVDNRPENLRYLCPNCHSQTPTHSHRKKL